MSRIRILSEHLANQIAAGEVVERPASVVKELVENALDAGADRVDIQVEGGGTRLIRVMDNGMGMDEDDVLLSLERHATSKLTDESQLGAIATLGFRGEAIPSIASVSRMTIISRVRDADIGTRGEIRYGTLQGVHEYGCGRGTLIEVRSLFANLPARRKFLKTSRTELSHIDEVIRSHSLAYPQVSFSLHVDGRKQFVFPAATLEQRVRDVFRYRDVLLPVETVAASGENDLQVSGYLLLPDIAPSSRLRILVNGRPVQDRMIRHAVMEGLQGFLMKGHQPGGALLLALSPELVDVNVHPAKREIRFRNAGDVHRFLVRAVAGAILRHQERLREELFSIPEKEGDLPAVVGKEVPVDPPFPGDLFAASQPRPSGGMAPALHTREPAGPARHPANRIRSRSEQALSPEQPAVGGLNLIGQFRQLYLLCERAGELVVIDQHAAHERILYQQLRHDFEQQTVPRQTLMFPETIELNGNQFEIMEREAANIASLGMTVEHFGDSTWLIKAVPALMGRLSPKEVLMDILEGLDHRLPGGLLSGVVPEWIDNLLASMACKAAVKAGNRLQPEEMLDLLGQMQGSDAFSHCPHGRPVIKTFSRLEIEKWFHRT